MKKLIAMLMVLVMMTSVFVACGNTNNTGDTTANTNGETTDTTGETQDTASDLAYVQDQGKLIVGITDYAPMDYKDDNGEWTGFDAELAEKFAEELGVECEFFVLADWGKKFVELETKNIDVIWNGMTITDEVKLNTNCSDPYVVNAQVVVVKADKVATCSDAASLNGFTIAVESGSAGEDAAETVEGATVLPVQDQATALLEVKAGTADACVIDITMANAMTGEGTSYTELAQAFSLTSEEYGVGFRKDSDLTAKLNAFFDALAADGTLQALAEKYELTLVE